MPMALAILGSRLTEPSLVDLRLVCTGMSRAGGIAGVGNSLPPSEYGAGGRVSCWPELNGRARTLNLLVVIMAVSDSLWVVRRVVVWERALLAGMTAVVASVMLAVVLFFA